MAHLRVAPTFMFSCLFFFIGLSKTMFSSFLFSLSFFRIYFMASISSRVDPVTRRRPPRSPPSAAQEHRGSAPWGQTRRAPLTSSSKKTANSPTAAPGTSRSHTKGTKSSRSPSCRAGRAAHSSSRRLCGHWTARQGVLACFGHRTALCPQEQSGVVAATSACLHMVRCPLPQSTSEAVSSRQFTKNEHSCEKRLVVVGVWGVDGWVAEVCVSK